MSTCVKRMPPAGCAFRTAGQQFVIPFNSNRPTFSGSAGELYQRLNPQIDMGQRTPQTIGEPLDYRNYLEIKLKLTVGPITGCVRNWRYQRGSGRDRDVNSGDGGAKLKTKRADRAGKIFRHVACCSDEAARLDARLYRHAVLNYVNQFADAAHHRAGKHQSGRRARRINWCVKCFRILSMSAVGLCGFAPQLPETLPGTHDGRYASGSES